MRADDAPVLQIEIESQPAKTVVQCTGKINTNSWTEFSTTVRKLIPEGKTIRVDLSKVTQIDSTGIGTLVQVWAAAKKSELDLKYVNPHKNVEDVIRITKLFPLFEIPEQGVVAAD
ncbi:MAG: STAS domain-containing protein [Terriglobales bacterium]